MLSYESCIQDVTSIREQIRILSQIWINVDYAREVNIPTQVKDLCVYAFVNKIPEGLEARVLREAYRRLEMGELSGEFSPFPDTNVSRSVGAEISAPWTDEQVAALNRYQQLGKGHPFTGTRHPDGSACIMVATNQGWIKCDGGPVIQTWAWKFMISHGLNRTGEALAERSSPEKPSKRWMNSSFPTPHHSSKKPEPEPCRHPRCHNVEWHHPGVGTGFSVECQPFTIGPTECECRVPARYGTRAEPTCAACGGTGYKRR